MVQIESSGELSCWRELQERPRGPQCPLFKMVPTMESSGLLFFPLQSKQSSSYSDRDTTEEESESLDDMDFLTRQKKLQAEAKMALAMAKPMAKMQVEVEKQNRKKSPVADLVSSKR